MTVHEQQNKATRQVLQARRGSVSKILNGGGIYLKYRGCYSGEEKRGVRKGMGGMVQGN